MNARRGFLGGSDMAAILGISPWASPYSVWAEKVGLVDPTHDESTQDRLDAGKDAELYLAAQFRRHEGLALAGEEILLTHPDMPWARGRADALVFDGNVEPDLGPDFALDYALGGWEAKTDRGYAVWSEVPPHYLAQIQWYMGLCGLERWWVTVGFGGWRTRTYLVERDQSDIDYMLKRADEFWTAHVLTGTPPDTDSHPATAAALGQAWPEADDTLFADDALRRLCDMALVARQTVKRAEVEQARIDNELKALMGDCAVLADADRVLATWRPQVRRTIDTKALKAAEPDLADKFTTETSTRTLLVKPPKES